MSNELRIWCVLIGVLASLSLSACVSNVEQVTATKPKRQYHTVALGDMDAAQPGWLAHIDVFRSALTRRLGESDTFDRVLAEATQPMPEDGIVVDASIVDIDKGNAAARFWIGFGAGAEEARTYVTIRDASGETLASFIEETKYGGWGTVEMQRIVEALGSSTADAVVRWSRGESLEFQPNAGEDWSP